MGSALGTAYTIWSSIGVVGSFVIGIIILSEQVNTMRIVAAAMILGGLLLMKLSAQSWVLTLVHVNENMRCFNTKIIPDRNILNTGGFKA